MKSGRSGGRFWKPLAGILPRWPRMRWPDNGDPGTKLLPAPGKSPNRAPDQVKSITATKEPFGRASFSPIRRARYLARQDAFEVEFADGLCFLESHESIRRANRIGMNDKFMSVTIGPELQSHFIATYASQAQARVSWSFVRENAPHEISPHH